MTRFRIGDIVVLNGHRLTVAGLDKGAGTVLLDDPGDNPHSVPRFAFPEHFLPDPEPREEADPTLARLRNAEERLRLARRALIDTGYFTEAEVGDDIAPRITEFAAAHVRVADVPREAFVPSPGEEEAQIEAARNEPPALTPGMTVAHRDGRLGVYESQNSIDGGLNWRPFGAFGGGSACSPPGSLRPVTLVEKPDGEVAASVVCNVVGDWMGVRPTPTTGEAVYDALFPDKP